MLLNPRTRVISLRTGASASDAPRVVRSAARQARGTVGAGTQTVTPGNVGRGHGGEPLLLHRQPAPTPRPDTDRESTSTAVDIQHKGYGKERLIYKGGG